MMRPDHDLADGPERVGAATSPQNREDKLRYSSPTGIVPQVKREERKTGIVMLLGCEKMAERVDYEARCSGVASAGMLQATDNATH